MTVRGMKTQDSLFGTTTRGKKRKENRSWIWESSTAGCGFGYQGLGVCLGARDIRHQWLVNIHPTWLPCGTHILAQCFRLTLHNTALLCIIQTPPTVPNLLIPWSTSPLFLKPQPQTGMNAWHSGFLAEIQPASATGIRLKFKVPFHQFLFSSLLIFIA